MQCSDQRRVSAVHAFTVHVSKLCSQGLLVVTSGLPPLLLQVPLFLVITLALSRMSDSLWPGLTEQGLLYFKVRGTATAMHTACSYVSMDLCMCGAEMSISLQRPPARMHLLQD